MTQLAWLFSLNTPIMIVSRSAQIITIFNSKTTGKPPPPPPTLLLGREGSPITLRVRPITPALPKLPAPTGALSFATAFLQFAGSGARVFTTLQEVDDQLVLLSILIAFTTNAIIFLQFLCYWHSDAVGAAESKKKQ